MSFALGRPDTLGMDEYHNRRLPPADNEGAIIPCMISLANLIRKVSIGVYQSTTGYRAKLDLALRIDCEIDGWISSLPEVIRPETSKRFASLKDPKWARRQRLVLHIRKSPDQPSHHF